MTEFEYLRPRSLVEALEHLRAGVPLAGGTNLTPRRAGLTRVVDLRDLGLDQIEVTDAKASIGAAATLQALNDSPLLPDALKRSSWLEGGWNLRNMATIGGLIMSSDARSSMLTVLLALEAALTIEPGGEKRHLDEVLDAQDSVSLITEIGFLVPEYLGYQQVARTPTDFPLVCVAVATGSGRGGPRIAIGGYGSRPIMIEVSGGDTSKDELLAEAAAKSQEGLSEASDLWASAEYRSSVAPVLVKRLLREAIEL